MIAEAGLMGVLRDPRTDARRLADVIGRDPEFRRTILHLANSPFYRRRGVVDDLRQAVVLIGFKGIARALTMHARRLAEGF